MNNEKSNYNTQTSLAGESAIEKQQQIEKSEQINKYRIMTIALIAIIVIAGALFVGFGLGSNAADSGTYVTPSNYLGTTPVPITPKTPTPTVEQDYLEDDAPDKESFEAWQAYVSYKLVAPKKSSYLPEIRDGEIQAPQGHSVYCFAGPSYSSVKLKKTIKHGETVQVMAKENGFYLVFVISTQRVAWVNSDLVWLYD